MFERDFEGLGKGTLDSSRSGIWRKDPYCQGEQGHLSTLSQRQERDNLLFQGFGRYYIADKTVTLKEGEDITLLPRTIHRIAGKKDSVLFEVSTLQLADIVRLQEDPKKAGRVLDLDSILARAEKS